MSNTLDLHGTRHDDVDRIIENFLLLHDLPLTIITGNSQFMRKSVLDKCNQFGFECHQWDSGVIKVLDIK